MLRPKPTKTSEGRNEESEVIANKTIGPGRTKQTEASASKTIGGQSQKNMLDMMLATFCQQDHNQGHNQVSQGQPRGTAKPSKTYLRC